MTVARHHFFVDPDDISPTVVTLRGDEAHHAGRVLRVKVGERISAADGSGRVVAAVVTSVGSVVEADIEDTERVSMPTPAITLFQAVAKGDKLEIVVEKATEVGVSRIVPFVAERTIANWDERKLVRVHERLRAIAKSAAKQSRSPFVPDVGPITRGPEDATNGTSTVLVLHEAATERLRNALAPHAPDELSLVVGPEGGLSDDEVSALTEAGATAVTLGPRVLRTETAGPVAAAVVGYAYGWFG